MKCSVLNPLLKEHGLMQKGNKAVKVERLFKYQTDTLAAMDQADGAYQWWDV